MPKITVNTPKPYDVIIQNGILDRLGTEVAQVLSPCKICLVTDSNVDTLYSKMVEGSLTRAGFHVVKFVFLAGEASKNLTTFGNLLEFLAENHLTRSDAIVALGGGVTGDLAGFAAATYLRGIQIIQVPTSFLAAVDSSVGGKTAVNLEAGKNLVGAFWQPSLVVCDGAALKTLPNKNYSDGIAETIKCGAISDAMLLVNMADRVLQDEDMIYECVRLKAEVVAQDEHDTGVRQLLNFGHTIGHAIEKCSKYTISHGIAVAIGMLIISKGAFTLGLTSFDLAPVLKQLYKLYNITPDCPYKASDLALVTLNDKKRTGDTINLIVPEKPGACQIVPFPIADLEKLIYMGLAY